MSIDRFLIRPANATTKNTLSRTALIASDAPVIHSQSSLRYRQFLLTLSVPSRSKNTAGLADIVALVGIFTHRRFDERKARQIFLNTFKPLLFRNVRATCDNNIHILLIFALDKQFVGSLDFFFILKCPLFFRNKQFVK